jgi:DNA repair protein RecO (recombination protein O)
MSHKSDCLVLRKHDFSETSQVLHLFSRDAGKIGVLAKGVKRKNNRSFEGVPDLLDLGTACWLETRSRQGLGILTEWRQHPRSLPGLLRGDLQAYYAGLYLSELLDGLTVEHDPHPKLFDGMTAAIESLADPSDRAEALVAGGLLLLRETGQLPEFAACVMCGRTPVPGTELHFSSGSGGIVCRDCEPNLFEKRYVSDPTARLLAGLAGAVGVPDAAPDPQTVAEANELLARHFRHLLGREPRTARFLGLSARPRR